MAEARTWHELPKSFRRAPRTSCTTQIFIFSCRGRERRQIVAAYPRSCPKRCRDAEDGKSDVHSVPLPCGPNWSGGTLHHERRWGGEGKVYSCRSVVPRSLPP